MASSGAIQKALMDMRNAIENGKFQPVIRKKNLDTLARLGITWIEAKAVIYALQERDYCKGPAMDQDDPESDVLWVFKTRVESDVIYIKFKIMYQEDGKVKVVSFHIDE